MTGTQSVGPCLCCCCRCLMSAAACALLHKCIPGDEQRALQQVFFIQDLSKSRTAMKKYMLPPTFFSKAKFYEIVRRYVTRGSQRAKAGTGRCGHG